MKQPKILYIEWCDAISKIDDAWTDLEDSLEWGEEAEWIVKEVGFVLKETKQYILLASRHSEGQYGGLFKIPKPWILKRKWL